MDQTPPKVFISYSWDSREHQARVLKLSDRLLSEGVDCNIDQYEDFPSEGWPRWMENKLEWAKFVLVICTEQYNQRFRGHKEAGKGKGVAWEGAIIAQELYDDYVNNTKFIPVIFFTQDSEHIPRILSPYSRYVLDTEEGYEKLYRYLTNQPLTPKPECGKLVPLTPRERTQNFVKASEEKEDSSQLSYTQPQFDVFLVHNSLDKPQVTAIAEELKRRGLKPWLDEEQIQPGRSFQDEIQQTILIVKSAAIFIGSQALGRWQSWELKTFISRCVEKKIPVIPVLLPGVSSFPEDLVFLKEIKWIKFETEINDENILDLLVWGITGHKLQKHLQLSDEKPGQIPQKIFEVLKESTTSSATNEVSLNNVKKGLNDIDIKKLTELLINSDRTTTFRREGLCREIGINIGDIPQAMLLADNDFGKKLIDILFRRKLEESLCKLCEILEEDFSEGAYNDDLRRIKIKLNCKQYN